MRSHRTRLLLCFATACAALIVALALAGGSGPPRAAGQPQPSLTPENQITIPGGRTLAPGEDVTFVPPPPAPLPTPAPGAPPIRAHFSAVTVHVINGSPGRVFVSLGAPDFTVTAFEDALVQLQTSYPSEFVPGGVPGLGFCGADDARGNVVRCRARLATMFPSGALEVAVTTVPEDAAIQESALAPGDTVHWIYPAADGAAERLSPALSVANDAKQPLTAAWDGAKLTAATDADVALTAGLQAPGLPVDQWPPSSLCAEAPEAPNALSCDLSGYLQVDATIRSLPRAPRSVPQLAYRDRFGDGVLSITPVGPDVAPGGEAVNVTVDAGGRSFAGQGALRPGGPGGQFALSFSANDDAGAAYLFTGELKPFGDTFAARGSWLGLATPHTVGSWQAGDADAAQVSAFAVPISYTTRTPDDPNFSFPGMGLPFLSDELVGFDPPGSGAHPVAPPTIAVAGQTIGLQAITTAPLVGSRYTYDFDFGDGSVDTGDTRQTVPHVYQAAGVYTIVAVLTDESGVQAFGATRIRIAPVP
ncbi:MAG TPA: PKD domain-containing protein [Dehalococcoidia bacterium]|nr:PKD domain-containing protein [Dehalococcoidia bacterium]